MKTLHSILMGALGTLAASAAIGEVPPSSRVFDALSLEQALEMAGQQHPQLAEARAVAEAASSRVQQAGALPNPELIVGAEQLPLNHDSLRQQEYVVGVSQPIAWGGRVGRAREAEELEREVRVHATDVARRDVRRRVQGAFATALYQEQAFQAQGRIAAGWEQAMAAARAGVETGDLTAAEFARVEMDRARSRMEQARLGSLRDQSLIALAGAIGSGDLTINSVAGSLEMAFELPNVEAIAGKLASQPELLQADAIRRASLARVDLATAERIPDVKVEVLYRRWSATRDSTLDVGLGVALPIFDRGKARVQEARAGVSVAEARARTARQSLGTQLHELHGALASTLADSRALKTTILPRAEAILRSGELRYSAGDISLTELLPLRREWASLQLSYLETLREVMQSWAALAPYLGQP